MNGSLIHTDLGPLPYVLFSLASIATGAVFELGAALTKRSRGRGHGARRNVRTAPNSPREIQPREILPREVLQREVLPREILHREQV